MKKIGIIGGAGYTAGELLRILVGHSLVQIAFVHSNSHSGHLVSEVHDDLIGETDLRFTDQLSFDIDALFLCVGHGQAKEFLDKNPIPSHIKIIDLSQDFRLNQWTYGLPELNKNAIRNSQTIANPGCFATCIQLALLPLAAQNQLNDDIHISATTGSTGAGQKPSSTTHFSWRNNNLSVYKAFEHQHLGEIRQSLVQLQPNFSKEINFIPYRGDFARGILAAIYTKSSWDLETAYQHFEQFYKDAPFVHLTRQNPHLKQVVNTNKCLIYLEKHQDNLFIISLIDNLTKGASGQAVQNMNLLFGFDEKEGLNLKAMAF